MRLAPAGGTLAREMGRSARVYALATAVGLWAAFELAVLAAAALASLKLPSHRPLDPEGVSTPFAPLGNALLAPLARFDAVHYARIAGVGYGPPHGGVTKRMAFFPLYPLLERALAAPFGGATDVLLLAGSAVAAACLLAALYVLHRLAELDLGLRHARPTLILTLAFPTAFFFAAPYTESLFLMLSVASVYCARTGRWARSGAAAALASASRPVGVLVLLPIAMLYLWGPREDRPGPCRRPLLRPHRPSLDILWLALAPLGLAAFVVYLQLRYGRADASFYAERHLWHHRPMATPAAFGHVLGQARGALAHISSGRASLHGVRADVDYLIRPAYVTFWAVATVGVARRLPWAYAAYSAASLLVALNAPPTNGLPRYAAVVFPLFMWLALLTERRRLTPHAALIGTALLAVNVTAFATWRFVG